MRHSSSGLKELCKLVHKPPANFPPLVELDLSFAYCGDDLLAELLATPWLSRLSTLGLGFTSITAAGGRALADCPFLTQLRVLSFEAEHYDEGWSTSLGPHGLAALAASPHLAGLRELDLGQNPVLDGGLHALAASRTLTALTWLSLYDAQVSDDGVAALVGSPVVQHLRYLNLMGENDLTDATLYALAGSPWLGNLQTLSLGGRGHSDPDFRLRDGTDPNEGWPARFSPDGWRALCESPHLGRLAWLHLIGFDGGGQDEVIEAMLRTRLGTCSQLFVNSVWGVLDPR
jgi:hypothetical protein